MSWTCKDRVCRTQRDTLFGSHICGEYFRSAARKQACLHRENLAPASTSKITCKNGIGGASCGFIQQHKRHGVVARQIRRDIQFRGLRWGL